MSTPILGVCDPHYTDKKPRSRKDNYQETQFRKTDDLIKLARHIRWDNEVHVAAAIAIAGDIFHQPRGDLISRRLDVRLAKTISTSPCEWFAILGNHDKDRDRLESIEKHPLGILTAARVLQLVHWPDYSVVGTDPPVIITGRQYTVDGPGEWLTHLKTTNQLKNLKQQISDQLGKQAYVLLMLHCCMGLNDGAIRGDPIIGHPRLLGTGTDVCLYGHPHTDDGIVEYEDEGNPLWVVGPGAFTRGTIAEHDVNRQPKIMLAMFHSNKKHEIITVPIPHEPPERVFDLEGHARVRRIREVEERFVQALGRVEIATKTPNEIIEAVTDRTTTGVINRTRQYLSMAEAQLQQG